MRCPVEIFTKRIDKVRDVISTHLLCYRSDRVKYNCVARRECQMSISPAIHHVVTTNTAALSPSLSWSLFSANQCSQRNPEFPQQVGLNDRPCQLWTVAEQINQFLPKHSADCLVYFQIVGDSQRYKPASPAQPWRATARCCDRNVGLSLLSAQSGQQGKYNHIIAGAG